MVCFHSIVWFFKTFDYSWKHTPTKLLISLWWYFKSMIMNLDSVNHYLKSVPIRSFFWSVFSPNTGKFGPEKAPYLDNFHVVNLLLSEIPWPEFYWWKYWVNLELLNVDLPYIYTYLFYVCVNSNILHFSPSFRAF